MRQFRTLARRIAYRVGALDLERARRPDALTVVMFHRVIDRDDPDFDEADPEYMIEAGLFYQLIGFFSEQYSVVSLDDVTAAADRRRPLPAHPLLITFDDGWADNLHYAAPLLHERGLPAVVFVVAETLLSTAEHWWQEAIFAASRRGDSQSVGQIIAGESASPADDDDPLELCCRFAALGESERAKVLAALSLPPRSSRMMLAATDLPHLAAAGIAVANHGYSHLPLTRVADPGADIARATTALAGLAGDAGDARVLSFPHGRYDDGVLTAARNAGIRLTFSSDPILNPLVDGFVAVDRPIGRISIDAAAIADHSGRLDPSAAATWLWRRPFVSNLRLA